MWRMKIIGVDLVGTRINVYMFRNRSAYIIQPLFTSTLRTVSSRHGHGMLN
jgi:hypothetical protein